MTDIEWRAALTPKIVSALRTVLQRTGATDEYSLNPNMLYVDSEIDLTELADAVIDVVLAAFDPPF